MLFGHTRSDGNGIVLGILKIWVPLSIVTTLLVALVAAAVQQDLRQSANDPQIQMAEDAAAAIDGGQLPSEVVPASRIDMSRSLAPFLIVFTDGGQPIASSVTLNGRVPSPPDGVFNSVRQNGEDRFTWEPNPGVRSAAVVTRVTRRVNGENGGFVLAGRSLREVEMREAGLSTIVEVAWAVTILGSLVAVAAVAVFSATRSTTA